MKMKLSLIGVAAILLLGAAQSNAQTVITGSSAIWLEVCQAAANQTAGLDVWDSGFGVNSGQKVFTLTDTRVPTIGGKAVTDTGAGCVVWNPSSIPASVVIFVNTDSVVGNRCFFANPACEVTDTNASATNGGDITGTTASQQSTLPSSITSLMTSGAFLSVNVAATDIRPEDAKFAIDRGLTPCGSLVDPSYASDGNPNGFQYLGLGYGNQGSSANNGGGEVGWVSIAGNTTSSNSNATGGAFNVLAFNLTGSDPISGNSVLGGSSYDVHAVGAVPIVVFVNPSDANGFGSLQVTNIDRGVLAGYLDGTYANTGSVIPSIGNSASFDPSTVYVREPLSGTYNTMEYSIVNNLANESSQDLGYVAYSNYGTSLWPKEYCVTAQGGSTATQTGGFWSSAQNPLNESHTTYGGNGLRTRAIGTARMIYAVEAASDGFGYAFWSAANFANGTFGTTAKNAKYLTVDGVDPIQEVWSDGTVPQSGNGLLPNVTLSHVRDGSYPIWSALRLVAATGSSADTVVGNLVTSATNFLSTSQPDFVPIPQLEVVRSHFAPPGQTPGTTFTCSTVSNGNNGGQVSLTTTAECGGDVGGVVYTLNSEEEFDRDNGVSTGNTYHRQ